MPKMNLTLLGLATLLASVTTLEATDEKELIFTGEIQTTNLPIENTNFETKCLIEVSKLPWWSRWSNFEVTVLLTSGGEELSCSAKRVASHFKNRRTVAFVENSQMSYDKDRTYLKFSVGVEPKWSFETAAMHDENGDKVELRGLKLKGRPEKFLLTRLTLTGDLELEGSISAQYKVSCPVFGRPIVPFGNYNSFTNYKVKLKLHEAKLNDFPDVPEGAILCIAERKRCQPKNSGNVVIDGSRLASFEDTRKYQWTVTTADGEKTVTWRVTTAEVRTNGMTNSEPKLKRGVATVNGRHA